MAGSGARRKKRRRKRARSDNPPREEGNSSSEEWERDSDQVGQDSPSRELGVSALHARSVGEPGAAPLSHFQCRVKLILNETSGLQELSTIPGMEWSSCVLIFTHCSLERVKNPLLCVSQ